MEEMTEKKFITETGNEVPRKNVFYKGDLPFLLFINEKGERVITDIPLLEEEVTMTPEKDPELSSPV